VTQPRALVVDDDVAIRTLISTILKRENFLVDTASDGSEAIETLSHDHGYDVVLLDLMMPRVDGAGVVAYLQKNDPQMAARVVLMTAFTRSAVARLGFACPILPKPFDLESLVTVARERVGAARSATA
jgi:two-component system response regulator PilR (NtrC family)